MNAYDGSGGLVLVLLVAAVVVLRPQIQLLHAIALVSRCRSSHCPSHSMSLSFCGTVVLLLVLER